MGGERVVGVVVSMDRETTLRRKLVVSGISVSGVAKRLITFSLVESPLNINFKVHRERWLFFLLGNLEIFLSSIGA